MRARVWMLGVAMAAAGEAGALSRAMWAEFNAIYYANLRPTAECNVYRTRSLELLKDNSLSPEALDTRMHALWAEAKTGCLQTVLPGKPVGRQQAAGPGKEAAPATTAAVAAPPSAVGGPAPASSAVALPPATAKVAAGTTSGAPDARPAAGSSDVAAGTGAAPANAPPSPAAVPSPEAGVATPSPVKPARGGAGSASRGEPRQEAAGSAGVAVAAMGPARVVPAFVRPPIDLPSPADLRLEAACAKRNPYAYQVETAADPCAKLARGKTPQSGAAADPARQAGIGRIGTGIALGMAVLAGVGAAVAGWTWWRRRRRGDAVIDERAHAADPAADDPSALRVPA